MMLAFAFLCVSFFVSLIQATPLLRRDVFSPHITSPNEQTVWPVGTKQMVTWETKDIPPDSQLTNPNGKVVLGHLGDDGSLNLQLEHPLAQNFRLRVGKVEITVPDVPARDDYIVVLFGDSGNASPAFAITRISGGPNSSSKTSRPTQTISATSSSPTSSSTLITDPIPITGTTITGGQSTATSLSSQPITTPTAPASPSQSQGTASSQSTQSTPSTQSAPASQQTSSTSSSGSTTSNSASAIRGIGSVQMLSIGAISFLLALVL